MSSILAHKPFIRATVTNFFFFLSLNGFVLLPLYIHALGGTEIDIGIVMGLYTGVGIVCQPLLGPVVDAVGRRPFMLVGAGLVLGASLLAIGAESIAALAVVRLLQGLGFSAFFVAMFSYVVDIVPPAQRGWALGIYGVSGFVSTAVSPLAGELIIRAWGFRALFVVSAVLAAVTVAIVWQVRDTRPPGAVTVRMGASMMRMGVDDVLQRAMAISFFFGLGSGTIFAFLPTFAESLGVRTLSLFYTAYAVAAIAVRVFGGRLIDTRGRRAVIVPSMFVQALSTGLLAALGLLLSRHTALPVLPVLFVSGLLSGGAHGFLYPGLAALVTDTAPDDRRASIVGVFSAVMLLGQTGGAFLFGYVTHAAGYGPMWWVLTMLLLLGAALSMNLHRPPATT
ncbi:MAG TPA: MFS transporter [Candidatus Limnocylindria bacterium]|nr:MFS transporter [Candidatus Limnocylindria bacterium]